MSKLFRYGGIAASILLIAFGVGALVIGANGRSEVRSDLKREQIVGTPDMAKSVANKQVLTGAQAKAFAAGMRKHTLEATGGQTYSQMGRFQHQMGILFAAWSQEADWHRNGYTPPVWEYLVQRHLNSYLPPMILVDVLAGYEIPAHEFYDPLVRRAFMRAGAANVLINDLHSAAFESDTDYFGSREQQTMLNLRVRDLDAMLAQLRAQGADVAAETEDMEGIGRFGWVTDPQGHRIELWQPA